MFHVAFCDDDVASTEEIINEMNKRFALIEEEVSFSYFKSGKELLYALENKQLVIDLLLLDVEMPEMDGIEVKNQLINVWQVRRIVFLTSHQESMNDAFGLKVVRFLMKPVAFDLLEQEILCIKNELSNNALIEYEDGKKQGVFSIQNLIYIRTERSYTELYLENLNNPVVVRQSFPYWKKRLEDFPVQQAHKGYMVCLYHVKKVTYEEVIMDSGEKLPIGRKYKCEFINAWEKFCKHIALKRML